MRSITSIVGIILILLGIVGLLWGGIPFTEREQVMDVGPLRVETQDREVIPVPPLAGGVALVGGLILVIVGARKE